MRRRLVLIALAASGLAWIDVGGSGSGGGISNAPNDSNTPALAIDPSGYPVIAWCEAEGGGNWDILLKRWDGTSWVELGGSATGLGVSNSAEASTAPSLALDSSGNPVVAWTEVVTTPGGIAGEIYVKRWDGAAWVEYAGSASGGGVSGTPDYADSVTPWLTLDASDRPVVAWQELANDGTPYGGNLVQSIYLRRWNGSTWEEVGGSATGMGLCAYPVPGVNPGNSGFGFNPVVALDGAGDPTVVWNGQYGLFLRQWDGTTWSELGGSASGSGVSQAWLYPYERPALVVDASGFPIVAWRSTSASEIYLKRWSGSSWVELAGSASGGGVSGTSGASIHVSMALVGGTDPVVAWADSTVGNYDIYLKRWTGTAWDEVDGSATGGGITNTAGVSINPSLALDAAGNPALAWEEDVPNEIYFMSAVLPQAPPPPPPPPAGDSSSRRKKRHCSLGADSAAGSIWILMGMLLSAAFAGRAMSAASGSVIDPRRPPL